MAAFASTIFSGALLLFLVQPLIGKYILPWFGGTPGVWTTCLLFFQLMLLAGYGYVHLGSRVLTARTQAMVHLGLLALVALSLPVTPSDAWKPGVGDDPTLRILLLLGASIGPSYFVLSTTGPLVQRWYSGLRGGAAPYRLYALSNVGSLLALLGYPFVIEPLLSRHAQAELWSVAMAVFVVLCGYCTVRVLRSGTQHFDEATPGEGLEEPEGPPPTARTYAMWLALPTVASLMLMATTNKLSQEVAAVPMLWVLPLGIYLLSFVLCFDDPRWYRRGPFGVVLLLWMAVYGRVTPEQIPIEVSIVGYSIVLFVVCMLCHGELYQRRPHPRHLTAFYFVVALGGALGGLLAALVAPLVFVHFEEFQLTVLATGVLILAAFYFDAAPEQRGRPRFAWACVLVSYVGLGYGMLEGAYEQRQMFDYATRDFHGGLYIRIPDDGATESPVQILWNGNTAHGMQVSVPGLRRAPTTYFAEETGVGLTMGSLSNRGRLHVGVVGLGIGTLAAYGETGDRLRFYEIDPRVARLAEGRFTYLADSAADIEIVLGDARLSLEREAPQEFDVLVLDAFAGDAIPVHLLTREAFDIYMKHLRPGGVIAVHISNRHLDLRPVLAALGERFEMTTRLVENEKGEERWWVLESTWVLMTRDSEFLETPAIASVADRIDVPPLLWTDERTSLLRVLGRWGPDPSAAGEASDADSS